MSWISGLADKAEQLLTTIDQNAAEKLQKKKPHKSIEETTLTEVTTVPSPVQERRRLSPPPSQTKKRLAPLVKSVQNMVNQSQEDDKLIDFLNDNSKPGSESSESRIINVDLKPEDCSTLESEKQMLKNEVRVLNNELSLLLHRTRAAEKETENLKADLQDAESSRLRLQEEVKKLTMQVKDLEHQNKTLIAEKKWLEGHSTETNGEKVQQLTQQVQTLQSQQEVLNKNLESKTRECVTAELARQQLQQEVESMTRRLTELRSELDQYRVRAQRTLSDKETLINQLRANSSDASVENSFQTELNQLREERQRLCEELVDTNTQLDGARNRLSETEQTLAKVREAAATTQQELQDGLKAATHRRNLLEDDFRLQAQELHLVREELASVRGELSAREAELAAVRRLPPPPTPPLHPGEIEARLSGLTRTLIQKQTALECVTTERNQLRMQLEELEHKHREHLLLLHQARVISANDTDDAKAQVPSFMVESPFDTGVARRVKRAYSSLDAVSIRTGVFLRRYPLARILVILYVVLLHLLVMLVLCSRTPDNAQK